VQQEIAADIYGRLRPKLEAKAKATGQAAHGNVEAYQLYCRDCSIGTSGRSRLQKGGGLFHPGSAKRFAIRAVLCRACGYYSLLGGAGYLPPSRLGPKEKRRHAALEIDDTLAEAHTSLALVKEHLSGLDRCRDGIPAGDRAESQPANTHHGTEIIWRTWDARRKGSVNKEGPGVGSASLIINTTLGWQLYLARRSDQAIEQLRKVLDIDARFTPARRVLEEVMPDGETERSRRGTREGGVVVWEPELAASIAEDFSKLATRCAAELA